MSRAQKIDIAKMILAAVLLIAANVTDIFVLYLAAYAVAGYRAVIEAFSGIIHGQLLDENFLMVIASLGAFYCGEYQEAVAVMLFSLIGNFFEHYAVNKSRKSIAELMDIKADFARQIVNGKEEIIEPEDLGIGDIILIHPGEKIPVDGIVIEGTSSLNTAALTGEAVPRDVEKGSSVLGGAVNLTGAITIKVTSLYEDSTVAKVLDLVENASNRKAPVEKFISKFARYYTPLVVAAAVLIALVPPVIMGFDHFQHWLYTAMIFLVVSCPCALVISVPLSLFAGIGSAGKQGILVKGSNYLEAMSHVKTMAFDKTGTLTTGKFDIVEICPADGVTEEELLDYASHGECHSNHPVAVAIKEASGEVDSSLVADYQEIAGKGISALYRWERIYCGNIRLMQELGFEIDHAATETTVVYVATEKKYLGYIAAEDTLRKNSAETLSDLKKAGVENLVMLTGDRKEIADKIAEKAGITKVLSDLLPEDKVKSLETLLGSSSSGKVAFVGDGINDAPVIARADVGIAMGALGSDAAIEAADVVILNDDISKISSAIKISRKTLKICKQNVYFALGVKFGVLLISLLGFPNMWLAVFADVGVSFIAILNAMRALKF